jgi:hypothetical protein
MGQSVVRSMAQSGLEGVASRAGIDRVIGMRHRALVLVGLRSAGGMDETRLGLYFSAHHPYKGNGEGTTLALKTPRFQSLSLSGHCGGGTRVGTSTECLVLRTLP